LFDETLRDRQPQTRAFTPAICAPVNLPEFLENNLLVLGPDAYPRIGYRYANEVSIFQAIDLDTPTLRGELDRVAEQVIKNLFETDSIGIDSPICFQNSFNLDIFRHCQWTNGGEHLW